MDEEKQDAPEQAPEQQPQAAEPPAQDAQEPPEPEGPDWKALARKWEERAKANKDAADAYEALKASSKADLDAANARARELEAELAGIKAAAERAEAVRQAAKAAGVDEAVLSRMSGDTAEEIADNARLLAEAAPRRAYPAVSDGGAPARAQGMTLAQIQEIKDPAARVMARAQNPDAR